MKKLKNAGIAKGEEKGIAERVGEEKRGKGMGKVDNR